MIEKISDTTYKVIRFLTNSSDTLLRKFSQSEDLYYVTDYFWNGQVSQEGYSKRLFPLSKDSTWINYSIQGHKMSEETYKNNELIGNKRWKENGKEDISNVFSDAEIMPSYKGGITKFQKYIQKSLKYPEEAVKKNINGIVYIQFVVMEDGRVDGINVVKGVHPILDNEAIRVIRGIPANWNPGYINGNPVRLIFIMPLVFKRE